MKTFQVFFAGCALAGLFLTSSCTANFDDINTNPNKMTVGDIEPSRMFEPILYGASRQWQYYTWYWNNELSNSLRSQGGLPVRNIGISFPTRIGKGCGISTAVMLTIRCIWAIWPRRKGMWLCRVWLSL